MTCHYTETHWRDALYNAVRATNGGVKGAASFLADRRGISIHPESLRRKLRGDDGLDMDVIQLLGEYVETDAKAAAQAKNWILSLAAEEGLYVDDVPPAPEGGWPCELSAIQSKAMQIGAMAGGVLGVTAETMADDVLDPAEGDRVIRELRSLRQMAHRMERNVRRAVAKGRAE